MNNSVEDKWLYTISSKQKLINLKILILLYWSMQPQQPGEDTPGIPDGVIGAGGDIIHPIGDQAMVAGRFHTNIRPAPWQSK